MLYLYHLASNKENNLNIKVPESRSYSQISNYVKSKGIPSPLKWGITSRRAVHNRNNTQNEISEYDPMSIESGRQKRIVLARNSVNPRSEK